MKITVNDTNCTAEIEGLNLGTTPTVRGYNKEGNKSRTYARTHRGRIVRMPEGFDLMEDFQNPWTHNAEYLNGKKVRCRVDHDATGTGTMGTGDTVVRII